MRQELSEIIRTRALIVHEASLGSFLKDMLKKVPGLPTKDQAMKVLKDFISKPNGEAKFKQLVDKIQPSLQPGKMAFDVQQTIRNLKGLANPMVIMSVLVLMGGVGKTEAGPLLDMLKGKGQQEQVQEVQIPKVPEFVAKQGEITDWAKDFDKTGESSGTINYKGTRYAVGKSPWSSQESTAELATKVADQQARKAGGKNLVERFFGHDSHGGIAMFSLFTIK